MSTFDPFLVLTLKGYIVTNLLLTRDLEFCLARHSSYVKALLRWVDLQKVGVGLLPQAADQEVKSDLQIKDRINSEMVGEKKQFCCFVNF